MKIFNNDTQKLIGEISSKEDKDKLVKFVFGNFSWPEDMFDVEDNLIVDDYEEESLIREYCRKENIKL